MGNNIYKNPPSVKFWCFFSSYLPLCALLYLVWKAKIIKASVHKRRAGKLCRERGPLSSMFSWSSLQYGFSWMTERNVYWGLLAYFVLCRLNRAFEQGRWESINHVVVAAPRIRKVRAYLRERRNEALSDFEKLTLLGTILIVMQNLLKTFISMNICLTQK